MKAKIVFGGENKIENEDELLAKELHKEYRNNRKYLKIKVFNKDDIWSADLIETVNVKNNDNFRYILTIIDLYTRFAWAIPLKNKTSNSIKEAFETLFENTSNRIPKKLWVKNFTIKYFKTFWMIMKLKFIQHLINQMKELKVHLITQ